MALPREPRQKMINLMYLVLTALLALNVSAEILNAFRTISRSIEKSNLAIEEKNKVVYAQIDRKVDEKNSLKFIGDRADNLKQQSAKMFQLISDAKLEILTRAKFDPKTGEYDVSNIDIPAKYLVEEGEGAELYKNLQNYLDAASVLIDEEDREAVLENIALDLTIPQRKIKNVVRNSSTNSWEYRYFNMTPVVASVAILNKFQSDVRNTEATILDYLFNKIGEDVIVYDQIVPFVAAESNYILLGSNFSADIGVGAISKSVTPLVKVNGRSVLVKDGLAKFVERPNSVGDRTLNIEIRLKKANGEYETVRKRVTYSVGSSAGVTVSADGMNLFYIGIDNPVTIIGQVGDEKMRIGISQGKISRKKAGKYVVSVVTPGDCYVSVQEQGKKAIRFPFRVKNIPDPSIRIGTLKPGQVKAADLRSQTGVLAILEDFEFDAYFTVESFKLLLSGPGFPDIYQADVKGGAFTDAVTRGLGRLRKGTIVTLIDVYVRGPDKKTRRLGGGSYIVK